MAPDLLPGPVSAALLFAALCLAIVRSDLKWRRIPDVLSLTLFAAGWAAAAAGWTPSAMASSGLRQAFWACVVAAGVFGLLYLALGAARVGLGDVKLALAVAPWLGLDGLIVVMAATSLLLLGAVLVLRRTSLPFAPFLAIVAVPLYALAIGSLAGGSA